MINRTVILLTLILNFANELNSQSISSNSFGNGLLNIIAKDSSYSMKFAIRFQSLFVADWNVDENSVLDSGDSKFMTRRARLKFDGFAFTPKLKYKIELGLSNKDISGASIHTGNSPRILLDAVVKWKLYNNFTIWAGQTKLPGNRERIISSANLQFVDRSMLNKNFNIDRDIGIQLRHNFTIAKNFLIREMLSFAQGEGRNIVENNKGGFQYTSRVELLPFGEFLDKGDYTEGDLKIENKPKLAIGLSYYYNDRAVKDKSNQGKYMNIDSGLFETNIYTIFFDAIFKYNRLSLLGEYANRTSDNTIVLNTDGSETGQEVMVGEGSNIQMGYLLKNNWEISARYSNIRFDNNTDKYLQEQYTLGFSRYIYGHNLKVQSDISKTITNIGSNLMYRLQFELHF